ncbi:MAG: hypothetical protein ACYDCG_07765 [Candidatus Acidiferrales bacterium]
MRLKNWLAASVLLPGLCLVGLPAMARQQQQQSTGQQQTGDPVADAARKAREQHRASPKPKKVYTDDDIKPAADSSGTGAAAGQGSGSSPAARDKGQGAASNGAGAGKGSEDAGTTWRKRFAQQREKIATAEKELEILQRESDKAQVQYYSDPQKAMMEQNSRNDINEKDAKIEQKKQQIANLKQQLSDMEDELRKSGGDPGWARE